MLNPLSYLPKLFKHLLNPISYLPNQFMHLPNPIKHLPNPIKHLPNPLHQPPEFIVVQLEPLPNQLQKLQKLQQSSSRQFSGCFLGFMYV